MEAFDAWLNGEAALKVLNGDLNCWSSAGAFENGETVDVAVAEAGMVLAAVPAPPLQFKSMLDFCAFYGVTVSLLKIEPSSAYRTARKQSSSPLCAMLSPMAPL